MKCAMCELLDADANVCSVANCTPLLIQQNDGSGLNRSWAEFKVGFGDPSGNYWLGNELIHELTANNRYKLRFLLQSWYDRNWYYAEYSTFIVLSEAVNYTMVVAWYSGNASFDALGGQSGRMFSTYDRENDLYSPLNCASYIGGGFWYDNCGLCRVNAARSRSFYFTWYRLPGGGDLQSSQMWLQCK